MKKATSRNQDPAWLKGLEKFNLKPNSVADLGGGKYSEIPKNFCKEKGIDYISIDPIFSPYYEPDSLNQADLIVCSNTLNVLDDDIDLSETIEFLCDEIKSNHNKKLLILIYEGEKNKDGRFKGASIQRNEKTKIYIERFKTILGTDYSITRKRNMFLIEKN